MSEPTTIVQHVHITVEPLIVPLAVAAHMIGKNSVQHIRDLVDAGFLVAVAPPTVTKKGKTVPGDMRICMKSIKEYVASGYQKTPQETVDLMLEKFRENFG